MIGQSGRQAQNRDPVRVGYRPLCHLLMAAAYFRLREQRMHRQFHVDSASLRAAPQIWATNERRAAAVMAAHTDLHAWWSPAGTAAAGTPRHW
jgi:hypothetical protein